MSQCRTGLLALLVLIGIGATAPAKAEPTEPPPQVREFLGERTIAILSAPTKVEVYRLGDSEDHIDPKKPEASRGNRIGGYPIKAAGTPPTKEQSRRLAAILFDEKTYQFDGVKFCIFEPGVAYRFWQGKESVEVLLCFACDDLEVMRRDAKGMLVHRAHEECDYAQRALLRLAKEALPNDKDIQALKEKGKIREFLGAKTLTVLVDPTKVEVFRLGDWKDRADPKKPEASSDKRIGGYPIAATGKAPGKEHRLQLLEVLFDEETYVFDSAKLCIFTPGVAYRFTKDKEVVEVLLCFSCDELEVHYRNAAGELAHSAHEDFDPKRATLVKLVKEALPGDMEIQALKEKGK